MNSALPARAAPNPPAQLGTVRRLHRGRAYDWLAPIWRLQYSLTLVAFGLGILGYVLGPAAPVVVVVGGLGALFGHSYWSPVGRKQGRRWVALCDDGLVTVSEHGGSAAIRWDAVHSTQHLPKRAHHVQFGTASSGTRYPETYQVDATTTDGRQVELVLQDLGRQAALVREIETRVTPHVLERARGDLERTGHAVFGPIVVTPNRLLIVGSGNRFDVPLTAVAHVGSRVLTHQQHADPLHRILSGMPTSRALQELVAGLLPDPAPKHESRPPPL